MTKFSPDDAKLIAENLDLIFRHHGAAIQNMLTNVRIVQAVRRATEEQHLTIDEAFESARQYLQISGVTLRVDAIRQRYYRMLKSPNVNPTG